MVIVVLGDEVNAYPSHCANFVMSTGVVVVVVVARSCSRRRRSASNGNITIGIVPM